MATTHVTAGDLITADLFNEFLTRLADVEGKVGSTPVGTVVVPIVFGRTLGEARATLTNPVNQLSLGGVFDTSGASVDPNAPANSGLRVIVQMPSFGARVAPGTAVGLVVGSTGGSGSSPTTDPPVINDIEPDPVAVGATATVEGQRFATPPGANTVLFDNVPGEVMSGNTVSLVVKVPEGIPGAPTAPGGTTKPNVNVVVRTVSGHESPAFTCSVSAPEANKPTIGTISPNPGVVGSSVTINGTLFNATPALNQVTFDGVPGIVSSATTTSLSVTVPPGITGLGSVPSSRLDVPVVVTVNGVASLPKDHAFARIS